MHEITVRIYLKTWRATRTLKLPARWIGLLGIFLSLTTLRAQPAPARSPPPAPVSFPFVMVPMPGGWFVARDETTQAQYAEVTGENPSRFPDPEGRRPVENVSWEDATAFCELLTARERDAGHLPAGWRYDLPTDAQFDEFLADADVKEAVTSLAARREDGPEPVGTRAPNRLGLRDVLGNVWEWCRDWYDESIRRKDTNPDVPAGALFTTPIPAAPVGSGGAINGPDDPPDERYKVLRGGAWDTVPSDGFTPRSRLRYAPGMANAHTGLRCVLVRDGE